MKNNFQYKLVADNKKARFNYFVEEELECGIALKGSEVKSLKEGKFSYKDSYVRIKDGEMELVGVHITPYKFETIEALNPERVRKLLAHKQEIKKLQRKVDEKGFSIFPLKFYVKNSKIKLLVGIGKGKKLFDKKNIIKERDIKKATDREIRDSKRR